MRVRRSVSTTLLAGLAATTLVLPLAGQAGAADPQARAAVPARGTAHMGMGVLKHDGRGVTASGGVSTLATWTEGVDVSSHQGNVAWSTLWNSGVKWFAPGIVVTVARNPSARRAAAALVDCQAGQFRSAEAATRRQVPMAATDLMPVSGFGRVRPPSTTLPAAAGRPAAADPDDT